MSGTTTPPTTVLGPRPHLASSPMLRRVITLLAAALLPALARAQPSTALGEFDGQADVGAVRHRGAATYDAGTERYAVSGAGANMWGDRDAFHFVWKRMTGDFILTARAGLLGTGGDPHRKFGWTVRPTLAAGAPHATLAVHGDGLTGLQFRRAADGQTEEQRSSVTAPDVIRLERRGGTYLASVARAGDTLSTADSVELALGDTVYVGLFVCAHDSAAVERASFRDVRVTVPTPPGFVRNRDYLGAALELLDVATGDRRVVYRSPNAVQAPNWTRDGRALLYNDRGRIYRFDLATRTPAVVPTGDVTNNNNDHVLSFDGRTLGLSHNLPSEDGRSVVYTVPARGGTPRRVSPAAVKGPSYLHGWSPDGRYLVYIADRDGNYDVYRVPAAGGDEVRLTTTPGLDDGAEYSPDGRWIYFNSVRSGTMQVWRMRPDGTGPEQVTNDGFNNWFPHVSPDGRWIAFLTFGHEVAPGDHPWYQRVYLRVMPAAGGPARVLAYVYGGQGTINVPSWSPDSRRVAFVSNSGSYGAARPPAAPLAK